MKKFILALLLVSPMVFAGESIVTPSNNGSKYVESDRFVVTDMKNPLDRVITDTKSGCQFLITYGNGISQIMIGCFEEYKKK